MMKRVIAPVLSLLTVAALAAPAHARDRDSVFFHSVEGQWTGPGEIVAGKYKGTKFTCTLSGITPDNTTGVTLDGSCNVGVFRQPMKASIMRTGGRYTGTFLDGSEGKGIDIVSGNVEGTKVVLGLSRRQLNGAMLARLADPNTMNVTISVKVEDEFVPVIGMSLKRIDDRSTASVAQQVTRD